MIWVSADFGSFGAVADFLFAETVTLFEPTIACPANLPSTMSIVDGGRPSSAKVIWPFSIGLPLYVTVP